MERQSNADRPYQPDDPLRAHRERQESERERRWREDRRRAWVAFAAAALTHQSGATHEDRAREAATRADRLLEEHDRRFPPRT